MGWFNQRQSQREIDEQHERYLQEQRRRHQEEQERFERGEAFKRWEYERERGLVPAPPAPTPRKRGR